MPSAQLLRGGESKHLIHPSAAAHARLAVPIQVDHLQEVLGLGTELPTTT